MVHQGKAILFYGLMVTTASLTFSARAHQQTQGPRLALDIISRRQQEGTLEVDGKEHSAIQSVPREVWDHVLGFMIIDAFHQAQSDKVASLQCNDCKRKLGTDNDYRVWKDWDTTPHKRDDCLGVFYHEGRSLLFNDRNGGADIIQEVRNLLQDFGLCLPSTAVWYEEKWDPIWYRLCAGSAIALPMRSNVNKKFPTASVNSDDNVYHSVGIFHPDSFRLPLNSAARFRQLLKMHALEVIKTSDFEVGLDATSDETSEKEEEEEKSEAPKKQAVARHTIEPQWMLWNSVDEDEVW